MGENIVLTKKEAIDVLKQIEFILISLHKIGSAYAKPIADQLTNDEYASYCKSTTEFIDNSDIMGKLSFIRSIISDKFNGELGNDDMDDIERAMQDIVYWPFN